MSDIPVVILDNLRFLQQGLAVLQTVADADYVRCEGPFEQGGVGRQFRHVLDHYALFLEGLPGDRIDYDRRERSVVLEQNRSRALDAFDDMCRQLAVWAETQPNLDRTICVCHNGAWCASTVGRELQHLINHTVHHYALIALILRIQSVNVEADFGVAPSTLMHNAQA